MLFRAAHRQLLARQTRHTFAGPIATAVAITTRDDDAAFATPAS